MTRTALERIAELEAEVERLRAALEPFANLAQALENGHAFFGRKVRDNTVIARGSQAEAWFTMGDLRRARDAHRQEGERCR